MGDVVTFTINAEPIIGDSMWTLRSGNGTTLSSFTQAGAFTEIRSYTVTGNQQDTQLRTTLQRNGPLAPLTIPTSSTSQTATCTPAGSTSTTTTDSAKLRALQVGVSKLVGDTSGAAITNAAGDAINSAFDGGNPVTVGPNGITFNFAAEPRSEVERRTDEAFAAMGYASNVFKAPPAASPATRMWSAWADIRGAGWDRNNIDLRGNQVNITGGVGYRLTSNLVIGVLAGYEHFKYDVASLTGTMKGDGGTIGGYAGWRLAAHLRWDATLAWSRISYDGVAGTASGSFHGSRLLASTGLTGVYQWAAAILEPSARVYALWEQENAYTDSLGTTHASRNFAVGRVSAGGRVIYPWISGDWRWSPYLGLYGDYRFSSDNAALPVGPPEVWIGNGLSARVTGGFSMAQARGMTLALGGELGGLGAAYKIWSLNGRVFWPF